MAKENETEYFPKVMTTHHYMVQVLMVKQPD